MSKQNANPVINTRAKPRTTSFGNTDLLQQPSSAVRFVGVGESFTAFTDDLSSSSSSIEYALQQVLQQVKNDHSNNVTEHDPLSLLYAPSIEDELSQPSSTRTNHSSFTNILQPIPNPSQKEDLTSSEVFAIIRNINDPEHPLTLEELNVVTKNQITVNPKNPSEVTVRFTPTIPHCSMATLIGLTLKVQTSRSLPQGVKTSVRIKEGTHASEKAVNKQLGDKERVWAALENSHLRGVVEKCIMGSTE